MLRISCVDHAKAVTCPNLAVYIIIMYMHPLHLQCILQCKVK